MSFPRIETIQHQEALPAWLTQSHFERCLADDVLQQRWEPSPGDWCFRSDDLPLIFRIDSPANYAARCGCSGCTPIDFGKDDRGRWDCDVFIATPEQLAALVTN